MQKAIIFVIYQKFKCFLPALKLYLKHLHESCSIWRIHSSSKNNVFIFNSIKTVSPSRYCSYRSFVTPLFLAFWIWNFEDESITPELTKTITVNKERSLKDNLSFLDHTSPNNTSSFKCTNTRANELNSSLPADTFLITS